MADRRETDTFVVRGKNTRLRNTLVINPKPMIAWNRRRVRVVMVVDEPMRQSRQYVLKYGRWASARSERRFVAKKDDCIGAMSE